MSEPLPPITRWVIWQDGDVTPDESGVGATFVKTADHVAALAALIEHAALVTDAAVDEAWAAARNAALDDAIAAVEAKRRRWQEMADHSDEESMIGRRYRDYMVSHEADIAAISTLRAEST